MNRMNSSAAKIYTENDMSKATQISHLTLMIGANIDHCVSSHLDESYGYTQRLASIANDGGYAAEGTLEIMNLDRAEQELCRLLEAIKATRNHLLENSHKYSQPKLKL